MADVVSTKAIYLKADGALQYLAPGDHAPPSTMASVPLPGGYGPETWEWNAAALNFTEVSAKVEASLLAAVKAEAERRKMAMLSPGGAKKSEYAEKRAEVNLFDSLGGTVSAILVAINAMPASQRAIKFAWATADSAAFGDTIDKAIGRFRAGIASSANVMTIAALEAKACAAIKAAATASAKRAAAASVTWPT